MLGLKLTRTMVSTVREWFYLPRFISMTHVTQIIYKVRMLFPEVTQSLEGYLLVIRSLLEGLGHGKLDFTAMLM